MRANAIVALVAAAATAALGCRDMSDGTPPSIREALRDRQIISVEQAELDGTPTLILAYRFHADLISNWADVVADVALVREPLQREAERLGLPAARIEIKSPSDLISMDFRRLSEGNWDEPRRALEVRTLPGGGRIGIRRVRQRVDEDEPWMSVSYVTQLDLKEEQEAVRTEAKEILSLFKEEAERAGIRKMLIRPTDRIHRGTSVGLVYRLDPATGSWE
jgi:hypothetical protein